MMAPLPPFPFLSSHVENDNIDYLEAPMWWNSKVKMTENGRNQARGRRGGSPGTNTSWTRSFYRLLAVCEMPSWHQDCLFRYSWVLPTAREGNIKWKRYVAFLWQSAPPLARRKTVPVRRTHKALMLLPFLSWL
jgi:hypothetical protein